MLNKTHFVLLILVFSFVTSLQAQNRIKRIFQDNNYDNRTNVIKNQGENDYNILDEQFGDAKVGEVVRITIEKPKPEKPQREKVVRERPKKIPTKKVVEVKPVIKKQKEVLTPKGIDIPPPPRKRVFSASPSEYSPDKTYHAQLPKVKLRKKKRRVKKNKSRNSCYHFRR